MTETETREQMVQIELIVDKIGMAGVTGLLAEICSEKAEHLRSSWQDEAAARDWERAGKVVLRCVAALMKLA